mmetsp:Transcript_14226/g.25916  ORF Transcript_14226/g.25916 Transcript_14226/m.25916 type:complete len:142 (-) Transcript_14226:73-498(-)
MNCVTFKILPTRAANQITVVFASLYPSFSTLYTIHPHLFILQAISIRNRKVSQESSDIQPTAKSAPSLFPSRRAAALWKIPSKPELGHHDATPSHFRRCPNCCGRRQNSGSSTATSIAHPLAVATLKTILSEFGVSVECRR